MVDRKGNELKKGDRVVVPCVIRDLRGRDVVLVSEVPINPATPAGPGSVHWLRPHQVERVAEVPETTPAEAAAAELVELCREVVASARESITAGRVSVSGPAVDWLRSLLGKIDARARKESA